jgi:hypothetical protein
MTHRSPRVRSATLYRFDSVREILAFCRSRYPTADVRTEDLDGEFMLLVRSSLGIEGVEFESLIVHFEGEGTYAVMLPDTSDRQTLLARLRLRLQSGH